jgi:hypothetical protein
VNTSPALRELWTLHPEWWPKDLADMLDIRGCVQAPVTEAEKSRADRQPIPTS